METIAPEVWFYGTVIVALLSLASSIIGAYISYTLTSKKEIGDENRKLRKEAYEALYFAIVNQARENTPQNKKAFADAYNRMLFVAADKVLEPTIDWKTEIDKAGGVSKLDSSFIRLMLDAMRKDIKLSGGKTITKKGFIPLGYD